MGRIIGAVVLGYVVVMIAVFAGLAAAYLMVGTERAFRPGSYEVSTLWVALSLIVGFGAALLAGWVSRAVARTATGPRVLAGVVLVLGLLLAVPAMMMAPDAMVPRPEGVAVMEAMEHARMPALVLLLNPLIGALGVLLGGRALGRAAAAPEGALPA